MNHSKQISIGVTFLICSFVILWLLLTKMHYDTQKFSNIPDPYITMEADEEFLEVEVIPPKTYGQESDAPAYNEEYIDNPSQLAPQTGTNLTTQGRVEQPKQTVTQKNPSTVQQKQQPTTDKSAAAIDKKAEEEKALAQQTRNLTKNAFAQASNKNNAVNGKTDEGAAGNPNGNPDSAAGPKATGTKSGVSGSAGGGWKMPAYSRNIPSNEVGSVTFEITVNIDGSPEKITQIAAKGLTSATISKCKAEIQSRKFTHPNPEAAKPTTARVTFTFVDPA